jgi:hypothetical protein
MKTRHGFVSNSSSSSFLISTSAYKSVFDLALHMIELRDKDLLYDNEEVGEWACANLKDIILSAAKNGMNENTPISFPTVNYDTFIVKMDNYYIVATCNNHPFYHDLKGDCYREWESVLKPLGMKHWEEVEDHLKEKFTFWFPKYNKFAKVFHYEGDYRNAPVTYCQKHYCDLLVEKDTDKKFCPECDK